MNNLLTQQKNYLEYCTFQKRLDKKTIKAYRIDLKQFAEQISAKNVLSITPNMLEDFIANLHKQYKPKTVKRKIASLKAFFHYLEYREVIEVNPFNKIQVKFREPVILPKTIPLNTVETLLSTVYTQQRYAKTAFQQKNALRDTAVIEMLFSTGMRISELCSLHINNVNLTEQTILIFGKGSKERRIQIENEEVINILKKYKTQFQPQIKQCQHFFANQDGSALSDQSIRRMLNKYATLAAIDLHITPHMFRHTFATCLLEEDVDIRYIQEMLGHSSINITEIYTHVALSKQRDILKTKHPRKNFHI